MRLPEHLQNAIDEVAESVDRAALARAAREISALYQDGDFHTPPLATAAHRVAYLYTRMPATYAANHHVFGELRRMLPDIDVKSMLDLGAGPGTSMWAAVEAFPTLTEITPVERDRGLIELGQKLASVSAHEAVRRAEWVSADAASYASTDSADLVVLSYMLGELPVRTRERLVSQAWSKARKLLIVIEPGAPRNFQNVLAAREILVHTGSDQSAAQVIAPCPHHNACPLATMGDWCHFAERLERTAEHRRLKGGELGYEDEKFSYVIGSRIRAEWPQARIVRHPRFNPGHVMLTLCTAGGLKHETIGKSQKAVYRAARNAAWGDAWPPHTSEVLADGAEERFS